MSQDETPNLTGQFGQNPFAAHTRGISDLERNYAQQRNMGTGGRGPGGWGNQVSGGPAGLRDSGAYWREVQGNELVTNQLRDVLNRGGSYIQGARMRAGRAASARGAFNTNQAIAEAESAAIERGGELAMQQADAFGRAAQQNQDAFNQYRLAQERNLTDIQTADIGAGATIASAQIRVSGDLIQQERDQRWRTSERESEQNWRSTENQRDRDQQTRLQDDEQDFRATHDMNVLRESRRLDAGNLLLTTFLGNPDLWGDPTALNGMRNMLAEEFPELFGPNAGSSTTTTVRSSSNPTPANVNSQQIGATPSGGSSGTNRYGSSGTRNPSVEFSGVTAGPYVPPPEQDARPGGMSGPPRVRGGGGGGRAGATSYGTMRNLIEAARNNRVQVGRQ